MDIADRAREARRTRRLKVEKHEQLRLSMLTPRQRECERLGISAEELSAAECCDEIPAFLTGSENYE